MPVITVSNTNVCRRKKVTGRARPPFEQIHPPRWVVSNVGVPDSSWINPWERAKETLRAKSPFPGADSRLRLLMKGSFETTLRTLGVDTLMKTHDWERSES